MKTHDYHTHIVWDGNLGNGTSRWDGYGRSHRIHVDGKPELAGSAHPSFRGEPERHDPEDLFLAAIASCHMLAYLALCARAGVSATSYEDHAHGSLGLEAFGGGRLTSVTLHPAVTISSVDAARAAALHDRAHEVCFIRLAGGYLGFVTGSSYFRRRSDFGELGVSFRTEQVFQPSLCAR